MASPAWGNENLSRSFPFRAGTVGLPASNQLTVKRLPDDAILDFGCVMGPESGFEPVAHEVYLHEVERQGDELTFRFGSNAGGLDGVLLVFRRNLADPRHALDYQESSTSELGSLSSASSVSGESCGEPLWYGYLVTGDLAALGNLLGSGDRMTRDNSGAEVEPTLIIKVTHVSSLGLANQDRTRADVDDECQGPVWPYETGSIFVNSACLTGEVLIKPGYNAVLTQSSRLNAIVFSGAPGAGEGFPCEQVPLFETEVTPADSSLLEGGPTCEELIRSLNGVGGPLLTLRGQGVTITPLPDEHEVVIDVDMNGLQICCEPNSLSEA